MKTQKIEKPIFGYVVITIAFIAGLIVTTAFGQHPSEMQPRLLPNQPNQPEQRLWILGIRAEPTETGYLVNRVEIVGAARTAGIERGDRIVAIGGQQVGFIGNEIMHLSRVLDRKADLHGRVNLLVQDHRTARLQVVPVRLRSARQLLGL